MAGKNDLSITLRNFIVLALSIICSLLATYIVSSILLMLFIRGITFTKNLLMVRDFNGFMTVANVEFSRHLYYVLNNMNQFVYYKAYFIKVILAISVPFLM